jgi:hypothetical protein
MYWCVWVYCGEERVCSRHRTLPAASRAARKCERDGGVTHQIYRVQQIGKRAHGRDKR